MNIRFHKQFTTELTKRSKKEQELVKDRLKLFLLDPFHPRLRNHPLKGRYLSYRSIDIRPDLRAVYKEVDSDEIIFITLGNHGTLYR